MQESCATVCRREWKTKGSTPLRQAGAAQLQKDGFRRSCSAGKPSPSVRSVVFRKYLQSWHSLLAVSNSFLIKSSQPERRPLFKKSICRLQRFTMGARSEEHTSELQ